MTFGERVKRRREELNLSQKELGERLGYHSRSSIAKIESGERNIKQSQILALARALDTDPVYLLGGGAEPDLEHIPTNIMTPAAYAVPILGTICAGDGVVCEQNYNGSFFVDREIKADYCLRIHGDSMVGAGISDGDYAFLRKDFDFEDGDIYAVVISGENLAVLKRVTRSNGSVILSPCNDQYEPMIKDSSEIFIVGKLCGIYHNVN